MSESSDSTPPLDHIQPGQLGQVPLFPPRPILLRILDESRNSDQTAQRIDPSKVIMASGVARKTITIEQANLLQSQRNRACETTTTHYHDLVCGHTVTTSTSFPAPFDLKSPCASNCRRSQPTTHCTLVPFICPQCLETLMRRAYVKSWKEYIAAGFSPDPDPSKNVKKWLCSSVRHLSKVGLRIVQGTSGLFLLGDEHKFERINFVPSVVADMVDRWSFRGRQRKRSRSRSPMRRAAMDSVSSRVEKRRSGSRGRKLERLYRDRSPLHTGRTADLDALVDRLADARIGLWEDAEVESLLEGVSRLKA